MSSFQELEDALNNREYCDYHKEFFNGEGMCDLCVNSEPRWDEDPNVPINKSLIWTIIIVWSIFMYVLYNIHGKEILEWLSKIIH